MINSQNKCDLKKYFEKIKQSYVKLATLYCIFHSKREMNYEREKYTNICDRETKYKELTQNRSEDILLGFVIRRGRVLF